MTLKELWQWMLDVREHRDWSLFRMVNEHVSQIERIKANGRCGSICPFHVIKDEYDAGRTLEYTI